MNQGRITGEIARAEATQEATDALHDHGEEREQHGERDPPRWTQQPQEEQPGSNASKTKKFTEGLSRLPRPEPAAVRHLRRPSSSIVMLFQILTDGRLLLRRTTSRT